MSIGLSEFWKRLVRSGIKDAAGCKAVALAFSQANGGIPPSDCGAVADFMVTAGDLTTFQSQSLLADPARDIRLGPYVIRADRSPAPFSRWADVARVDGGGHGFLLRTPPGNAWLQRHAQVQAQSLQPFQVEQLGEYVAVFSPLAQGELLHERIGSSDGAIDARVVCEIGIVLAEALTTLHASSLIHGSVRADRVWMTDQGQSLLLRDPSGPPTVGLGDSSSRWLDTIDAPEAYLAPELAGGVQPCSASSDLYSLGCLLFRLMMGRSAFVGTSVEETLQKHRTESPCELTEALERGESGDPVCRVLAYAMAKNPAARFSTPDQLAGALRAVLPLLPASSPLIERPSPVTKPKSPTRSGSPKSTTSKKKSSSKTKKKQKVPEAKKPVSAPPKPPKDDPIRAQAPTAKSAKTKRSHNESTETNLREEASREKIQPAAVEQSAPPNEKTNSHREVDLAATDPQPRATPPPSRSAMSEPPSRAASSGGPIVPATAEVTDAAKPPPQVLKPPPVTGSTKPATDDSDPASPSPPQRRRRKKKSNAPLALGGLAVVVLMLLVALLVSDPNEQVAERKERPPFPAVIPPVSGGSSRGALPQTSPANQTSPVNNVSGRQPTDQSVPGYELVSDGRLLFVPPLAADSEKASLELLPPGPAVIVSARLASILQSRLGSQILEALSPELSGLIETAVTRAKVPADSISRCSVAMHPGSDGWPKVSLAIELKQPQSLDALVDQWQVAASRTRGGATIYAGEAVDSDAFYVLPAEVESKSVSRFAVGPIDQISEVAALEGGAIPLPTSMRSLWNGSSAEADLVALITPNFLFADGREMLRASAPELVGPLKSVLIPDAAGVLVTAHVDGDRLFSEVRLVPSGGISEAALMRMLSDAIGGWPNWADEFIVDSVPDPSWRLLASRLPMMMRFAVDQIRYGISDQVVVANVYLPERAVPQLTLATLLAMNTASGGAKVASTPAKAQPMTIDEMLDRKMSVSFDQESLEFAIDAIVGEFKRKLPPGSTLPPIRIIGGDLQEMGITQNQQIRDFAKTEVPLRLVLTDLVVGANPDKTAAGPNDSKQSLIWVVAEDPQNAGKQAILVTTRQSAANKYKIPEEFQVAQ